MRKLILLVLIVPAIAMGQKKDPVKIGIAGLTHGHVGGILRMMDHEDFEIVGIAESNTILAERLASRFKFSMDLVYPDLAQMIEATKPQAVAAFNSTYEHLSVVEICAPRGVDVMVEKPLAVSMEHAEKMRNLAKKHDIELITNYETTWYATNHRAFEMVNDGKIGPIRKIVIHDGHAGPKEIGVSQEFLEWLVDPKLNGGGALTDFGCYGANLATWLMKGERPESVIAMTHTNKPHVYEKVDDEASIILQYPEAQVIIQASWNWPYSRKDMEVYGVSGAIFSDNARELRFRLSSSESGSETMESRAYPFQNPYTFFASVVRGEIKVLDGDLSSLENNLIVVEILDAARESAKQGTVIRLK